MVELGYRGSGEVIRRDEFEAKKKAIEDARSVWFDSDHVLRREACHILLKATAGRRTARPVSFQASKEDNTYLIQRLLEPPLEYILLTLQIPFWHLLLSTTITKSRASLPSILAHFQVGLI